MTGRNGEGLGFVDDPEISGVDEDPVTESGIFSGAGFGFGFDAPPRLDRCNEFCRSDPPLKLDGNFNLACVVSESWSVVAKLLLVAGILA